MRRRDVTAEGAEDAESGEYFNYYLL